MLLLCLQICTSNEQEITVAEVNRQRAAAMGQEATVQDEVGCGGRARAPDQVAPVPERSNGPEGQQTSGAGMQLVLQSTAELPEQVLHCSCSG